MCCMVNPIVVAADWVPFGPWPRLSYPLAMTRLAVPLVYVPYSLIRGVIIDWYPLYPFLNPHHHGGGYGRVALNAVVLAVAMALLAAAVDLDGPTPAGPAIQGNIRPVTMRSARSRPACGVAHRAPDCKLGDDWQPMVTSTGRRVRRGGRPDRSAGATARRGRPVGSDRLPAADGGRDVQARPHPRRRPVRPPLRGARVRSRPVLPSGHPPDQARTDLAGLLSCRRAGGAVRRPRAQRDAAVAARAARAGIRRCARQHPRASSACGGPWHRERTLPALRDLLELPFERSSRARRSRCTIAPPMSGRSNSIRGAANGGP